MGGVECFPRNFALIQADQFSRQASAFVGPPVTTCQSMRPGAILFFLLCIFVSALAWATHHRRQSNEQGIEIVLWQPHHRRHDIIRELCSKVPQLGYYDAAKIAVAIDDHDDFDHPGSLYVRSVGFREIQVSSSQAVGAMQVAQRYPRLQGLHAAISEAIDEQKVEDFPVRKEISLAGKRAFKDFPSIEGKVYAFEELYGHVARMPTQAFRELQALALIDFRAGLKLFEYSLWRRLRDVQFVLRYGWMPADLLESFAIFELLCGGPRSVATAQAGRLRAARWLRWDPYLRFLPVRVAVSPTSPNSFGNVTKVGRKVSGKSPSLLARQSCNRTSPSNQCFLFRRKLRSTGTVKTLP